MWQLASRAPPLRFDQQLQIGARLGGVELIEFGLGGIPLGIVRLRVGNPASTLHTDQAFGQVENCSANKRSPSARPRSNISSMSISGISLMVTVQILGNSQ